jgi:MYXO-CTERM domain-containing protein
MKQRQCAYVGAVATILAITATAAADMTIHFDGQPYGTTNGGEFRVTPTNFGTEAGFDPLRLTSNSYFETFCVERNEYISIGHTYYVDLSTEAKRGGVGGGSPDPLSPLTAYLYSQFIDGTLVGYDYANTGIGRNASADALQKVIWYIEDEYTKSDGSHWWTPHAGSLAEQFYNDALANNDGTLGNVLVMNLYKDANRTCCAQDQLVAEPVPAPGAVLLGAIGLGMIVTRRRRRDA